MPQVASDSVLSETDLCDKVDIHTVSNSKEEDDMRYITVDCVNRATGNTCKQSGCRDCAMDNPELDVSEAWRMWQDDSLRHVKLNPPGKWSYVLHIQNLAIPVKLDTGAGADLLNLHDYNALRHKPQLRVAKVRLTDYNNRIIEVHGECVTQVSVKGL